MLCCVMTVILIVLSLQILCLIFFFCGSLFQIPKPLADSFRTMVIIKATDLQDLYRHKITQQGPFGVSILNHWSQQWTWFWILVLLEQHVCSNPHTGPEAVGIDQQKQASSHSQSQELSHSIEDQSRASKGFEAVQASGLGWLGKTSVSPEKAGVSEKRERSQTAASGVELLLFSQFYFEICYFLPAVHQFSNT